MIKIKYDLGIRYLIPEWKSLVSKKYLYNDFISGMTVACIAIPLSLAIALASGVPPAVGLVTAIIGGIVCALFGGTPLSVSGPAAAMSVLIAANVETFGMSGLLVIGFICGLLQVISGVFGFGALMKFIPLPVIGGFTAGIGAIIFIGQLPRAFDLPPPDQSHVFSVVKHIGVLFQQINIGAVSLTLLSLILMQFLPKINQKLPSPLFAIIIPTVVLFFFPGNTISTIGEIPRSLPWPAFPVLPSENVLPLIFAGISVYFLASLETLLSSSAVDKMTKGKKHDSNQELIGQGIGNVASAFFGGIPVTGVIARTALNVNSGGKTRRSSIIHSFILIACIYFFAPFIKYIPIPALAGILISVAMRMLDIKSFFSLFQVSKSDAYIFLITFVTIVFTDLLVGIQAGLLVTAVIALVRMTKTYSLIDEYITSSIPVVRCSIKGYLTFISSGEIERITEQLKNLTSSQTVVIDVSKLKHMDISGAALFSDLLLSLKDRNIHVIIKNLTDNHEKMILENLEGKEAPFHIARSESEILKLQESRSIVHTSVKDRLLHGSELFKTSSRKKAIAFEKLATFQDPHTLFITCADSRIVPNLITSCDPGELFVIRNVGNVIPVYSEKSMNSESAALEFALRNLNLRTIIICAHSNCGAVCAAHAKIKDSSFDKESHLDNWLKNVHINTIKLNSENSDFAEQAKENVLYQMKNMLAYPLLKEKVQHNKIDVFAWYYDIPSCNIEIFSDNNNKFMSVEEYRKVLDLKEVMNA